MKKAPNTFVIVFVLIILATLSTFIIPSGEFERKKIYIDGNIKETIDPKTFKFVKKETNILNIFTAIYDGFTNYSHIIVFILVIGGAFNVINSTKFLDNLLLLLLKNQNTEKSKNSKINAFLIITFIIFSLFGAIFGMSEETIPFVILFTPFCLSLGYTPIFAVSITYLAAHIGFASAFLNPFTIGIAQGLSNLPLFSGLEYRFFIWLLFTSIGIVYVFKFSKKLKQNNSTLNQQKCTTTNLNYTNLKYLNLSFIIISILLLIFSIFKSDFKNLSNTQSNFLWFLTIYFITSNFIILKKNKNLYSFNLLIILIILLMIGVTKFNWYIKEICGLFFGFSLIIGLSYGLSTNEIVKRFIEGAKDLLPASLIVGFAGGIIHTLQNAKVIDTILFYISNIIGNFGKTFSLFVIYLFQNFLNIIVPSGSAKAALTIPITSELVEIIGISKQINVLAFQFGDGITNFITPTSAVLLGALSCAKVDYYDWIKYIWKLVVIYIILGFIFTLLPLFVNIKDF